MIIYSADKQEFFNHVTKNEISKKIEDEFKNKGLQGGSNSEMISWINSLNFMKNILDNKLIPNDVYVAIEYKIPYSSKRIDFIITAYDDKGEKNVIVIELKQWLQAKDSSKEDMVSTYLCRKQRDVLHPSYQALQYKYLLNSFNKELNEGRIKCFSCAYLHNADKTLNYNLVNIQLYSYIDEAPLYFKQDYDELQKKIIQLTGKGKGKEILYEIENGEVVPAKKLIETIGNTIKGKKEYLLIDSQKEVFSKIIEKANSDENIFIINGNPGTGKSVVAINLLSKLLDLKKKVVFSAPNAAFRNIISNSLKKYNKGTQQKIMIDNLFKGSSVFYDLNANTFDWIIVDEAHRLKSEAYMYKGKNQIEDIIKASKNAIFFVDENQVIRSNDIGTNKNIIDIANKYNKKVYFGDEYKLETQFRCSGADGYINAIDNILQIKETANHYLNDNNYEVKICDSPSELQELIRQKQLEGKDARIVAGFAWDWITKDNSLDDLVEKHDIKIGDWSIPWNYNDKNMLWAIRDDGIMQAGCVHTCQGLEFDYCGVIIGNDLLIDENNELFGDYNNYKDKAGKKGLKNNQAELTRLLKNIYKILLTRGQKGTFIYICDEKLKHYFLKHIKK